MSETLDDTPRYWHCGRMPQHVVDGSPRSSAYRLLNKLMGGHLAKRMGNLRRSGLSWEAIAQQFHADHGVTVSGQTLRNWAKHLDIDDPEAKASA